MEGRFLREGWQTGQINAAAKYTDFDPQVSHVIRQIQVFG
jgi:hypothetical protein